MRSLVLFSTFLTLAATGVIADEARRLPVAGDCAMFREGGVGYILTTPTYWLRGRIEAVYTRPHRMALCPQIGKPRERYSRDDWMTVADAYPCVTDPAKEREVQAVRIRMRAEAWDTPWSQQHGHNGWLFRGHFLKTELKEGVLLDIDGTLLERCEAKP
ncbi:MAG: hypothetical protein WC023_02485 [Rhodocyclaceae bacterium]|jgi:hypothetical protein